jgi:phosphonatase-like hydrolase
MKNIDLIVFDLAGTTVHDNKDVHRVLRNVLKQIDVTISIEDANRVMGIPKPVAIRQLLSEQNYPSITDEFIDSIHKSFVSQMVGFYKTSPEVKEKEGVSDTFRKLKAAGIKIVVDTGFDRIVTNAVLERMGWQTQGLIDASVTSDEVERGRPYPDLIFKAMELTHITDVKRVAKVGDTAFDLQEGSSAGCGLVVGITSGAFSKEELEKEIHTNLILQIPEIMAILEII